MQVNLDEYRQKICDNVPQFADTNPDDLVFTRFTTALTNIVHSVVDPKTDCGVVFRIFGHIEFGDRDLENEVCVLLGNHDVAPKILYSTHEWRLEEFVKGDALDTITFREEHEFQTKAMKLLARFHKIDASEVLEKEGHPWAIETIQHEIEHLDLTNHETLADKFPNNEELMAELKWLHAQFEALNSTLSFCHNDYRPANIIRGDDHELNAVDFDTVGYNYRGYDIGRALNAMYLNVTKTGCEWIDNAFPPENIVRDMLIAYLQEDLGYEPSEENIERLHQEVVLGNLGALLHLTIWSAEKSCSKDIKWDYATYSSDRLRQYYRAKAKHASTLPTDYNTEV